MRNIKLEWTIEGLENGYLVPSSEINNKKFFEKLEDAKEYIKKQIDEECKIEWEEEGN